MTQIRFFCKFSLFIAPVFNGLTKKNAPKHALVRNSFSASKPGGVSADIPLESRLDLIPAIAFHRAFTDMQALPPQQPRT